MQYIIAVSFRISLFLLREQFLGQTTSSTVFARVYVCVCVSLNECNEFKGKIRRECAERVAGLGLHAAARQEDAERYAYQAQSPLREKKRGRIKKVEERREKPGSHVTSSIEEADRGRGRRVLALFYGN